MGVEERRLCIYCKHFFAPQYSSGQCRRPERTHTSLVDGSEVGELAANERATFGGCGLGGEFYESKQ